jgi:hypothetical protein
LYDTVLRGGVGLKFDFHTDEEAYYFCREIIQVMMGDFGITEQEALSRLNYIWKGDHFEEEVVDIRYHEDPQYWAYHTYYGSSSEWWNREGDPTLKPRPLPEGE